MVRVVRRSVLLAGATQAVLIALLVSNARYALLSPQAATWLSLASSVNGAASAWVVGIAFTKVTATPSSGLWLRVGRGLILGLAGVRAGTFGYGFSGHGSMEFWQWWQRCDALWWLVALGALGYGLRASAGRLAVVISAQALLLLHSITPQSWLFEGVLLATLIVMVPIFGPFLLIPSNTGFASAQRTADLDAGWRGLRRAAYARSAAGAIVLATMLATFAVDHRGLRHGLTLALVLSSLSWVLALLASARLIGAPAGHGTKLALASGLLAWAVVAESPVLLAVLGIGDSSSNYLVHLSIAYFPCSPLIVAALAGVLILLALKQIADAHDLYAASESIFRNIWWWCGVQGVLVLCRYGLTDARRSTVRGYLIASAVAMIVLGELMRRSVRLAQPAMPTTDVPRAIVHDS